MLCKGKLVLGTLFVATLCMSSIGFAQGASQLKGGFVMSFSGPGGIHDDHTEDREVAIGMIYYPPGDPAQVEPKEIFAKVGLPAGTTPAAAARVVKVHLMSEGVDPKNIFVFDSTIMVDKGVEVFGYQQKDPSGLRASGIGFKNDRKFKKMEWQRLQRDRTWTSGEGTLTLAITGEDSWGNPAAEPDRITLTIKRGLSNAQLDQFLLSSLATAGWQVSLLEEGRLRIEGGPTVESIRSVKTFVNGDPGFLPLGGQVE